MCGVDRVVLGSDYGPIPYGIKEHVQIFEYVLPSPVERQRCEIELARRCLSGVAIGSD
jgi:hypothetical protein